MKTGLALAVLVVVGLASCVPHHHRGRTGYATMQAEPSDIRLLRVKPNTPLVELVHETILVVDQEPIYFPRNYTDKSVEFELLAPNPAYVFVRVTAAADPSTGHRAITNCRVQGGGKKAKCDNDGTPGQYKYTLEVGGGPAGIPPLDPWIMNGR